MDGLDEGKFLWPLIRIDHLFWHPDMAWVWSIHNFSKFDFRIRFGRHNWCYFTEIGIPLCKHKWYEVPLWRFIFQSYYWKPLQWASITQFHETSRWRVDGKVILGIRFIWWCSRKNYLGLSKNYFCFCWWFELLWIKIYKKEHDDTKLSKSPIGGHLVLTNFMAKIIICVRLEEMCGKNFEIISNSFYNKNEAVQWL